MGLDGQRQSIVGAILQTLLDLISTARSDGVVTIDVEDTGPGVRPEDAERIFLPFHSTKPHAKFTLYAKYGVPHCWLVDPEARTVEAFALGPNGYSLVLHATGPAAVSPPPFAELALVPDALWP